MSLAVLVQHHPSRAHLIPALRARLGDCRVVTDPNPDSPVRSALRCYLECIRQAPRSVSHVLIVQDDAWPCEDWRSLAETFIAAHPDVLVPLFIPGVGAPGAAVRRAVRSHSDEAHIGIGWVPTVALSWPQEAAQSFLRYAEDRYDVERMRGDDGPVGAWRAESRIKCVGPVPSLIEHPDVEFSLFRGKPGRAGANRARVARAIRP